MSISEDQLHLELTRCKESVYTDIKAWLEKHEKTEFDKHDKIDSSLQDINTQLLTIGKYIERGHGAVTVLKWLAYAAAAVWAIVLWAKDHIKL